jgi:hypothetical protein
MTRLGSHDRDLLTGCHQGARRQPGGNRLVRRAQPTGVGHGEDPLAGDLAGEADDPGPCSEHRLSHPGGQVDAAVAGAPGRGGQQEAPDHRRCRIERPPPPRTGWSRDGGPGPKPGPGDRTGNGSGGSGSGPFRRRPGAWVASTKGGSRAAHRDTGQDQQKDEHHAGAANGHGRR